MAPLELEGENLGQKHRNFNKLAKEAVQDLVDASEENDISQLLNIDIASKNRNVEYILTLLKSEDDLHASKAIKRSTWLITDPKYANIINPEYIFKELKPQMTTKAFNKFILHVRLNLKDENRVESFYKFIKEIDEKSAFKWLQHCSVPFVEPIVAICNRDIPEHLVVRLFEKSFSIFEAYHQNVNWMIKDSQFVLKTHTEKYLDFIEKRKNVYYNDFTANDTELLMLKCYDRIINKIDLYGKFLHVHTLAKYLNKKENIADFLMKRHNDDKWKWLFTYQKIQHFVKLMPKESRFEFVKKIFIDKNEAPEQDIAYEDSMGFARCAMKCSVPTNTNTAVYQWYKFAPFDTAFTDLRKLIRAESAPDQRTLILQVLLGCAGRNMQNIRAVLQYYFEKHINEPFKFKINFVNIFISKVDTHSLDDQTWGLLNQLFHSMEVYIESENNVQSCIKAIIVRQTIRNEPVPDIIKKKFVFDTLSSYNKKLKTQEEKDVVFKYLQDHIAEKFKSLNLTVETEFEEAVTLCEQHLKLINDWEKELSDQPGALFRVKELVKIKNEKQWKRDFSPLYNIKKSWRKAMFEESIAMMQNENVCMNALKHDPELLNRNKEHMLKMLSDGTISLNRLLRKMRVYWPHTLSEAWKAEHLKRMIETSSHKSIINGLCTLLSKEQIDDLLKKHAPSDAKINWNESDQHELSVRKHLAQNVHKARPLPALEGVLQYAKGDYLQYAVPSLNSILSQLSPNKSRLYVPTLLEAPVSLQKFGVRCAFQKLPFEELKPLLSKIWKTTKNTSIRTVLFTHTYDMLCKEKNNARIKAIWELLSMFIDNLTSEENKLVYEKLGQVSEIPVIVKPQFFMKSYIFLSSLPKKCNCESIIRGLHRDADDIMERLDNDFVVNVMLKDFFETFIKKEYIYDHARVLVKFILGSKDEETQLKRYKLTLAPILEKYLPQWETIIRDSSGLEGKYRIKGHIHEILQTLCYNMSYTLQNKLQIPSTLFKVIQDTLEKYLTYEKDYNQLSIWKLATIMTKKIAETEIIKTYYKEESADKNKDENDKKQEKMAKIYSEIHKQIRPEFNTICAQYLREDKNKFGYSVYTLFADALGSIFYDYFEDSVCSMEEELEYVIWLLQNENDAYVWLMLHRLLKKKMHSIYSDEEKKKLETIRTIVFSSCCPTDEVKMHFYKLFSDKPPVIFTTTS